MIKVTGALAQGVLVSDRIGACTYHPFSNFNINLVIISISRHSDTNCALNWAVQNLKLDLWKSPAKYLNIILCLLISVQSKSVLFPQLSKCCIDRTEFCNTEVLHTDESYWSKDYGTMVASQSAALGHQNQTLPLREYWWRNFIRQYPCFSVRERTRPM